MKYNNPYIDYATCSACGFKKLCRLVGRKFVCKACDIENIKE